MFYCPALSYLMNQLGSFAVMIPLSAMLSTGLSIRHQQYKENTVSNAPLHFLRHFNQWWTQDLSLVGAGITWIFILMIKMYFINIYIVICDVRRREDIVGLCVAII